MNFSEWFNSGSLTNDRYSRKTVWNFRVLLLMLDRINDSKASFLWQARNIGSSLITGGCSRKQVMWHTRVCLRVSKRITSTFGSRNGGNLFQVCHSNLLSEDNLLRSRFCFRVILLQIYQRMRDLLTDSSGRDRLSPIWYIITMKYRWYVIYYSNMVVYYNKYIYLKI